VSQSTKEKVMRIVDEMGYFPNLTAQSLKTKKTFLVGVMFSKAIGIGIANHYYASVIESFRKAIGSHGYDTIFINKTLGDNEIGYLEHCKYRSIDGIYVITAKPEDINIDELNKNNIKCITTDVRFENTPFVSSDNVEGSKMAVNYLYNMGHRRLSHISGPRSVIAFNERYKGYIQGLEELGLEYDKSYCIEVEGFSHQLGYEVIKNFLQRFTANNRPTALCVGLDALAIDAIQAIKSLGLRVPEDISVIGFDDIDTAKYISPPLTTVAQNMELIGETIANTLFKLINNNEWDESIKKIPVKIIERASVIKLD